MTPDRYLNFVISAATPDQDAKHKASRHRDEIESWLQRDLDIFRILETGSWSHGTAAWPWSDVDYFASMRGVRPQSSQSDLENLRSSLARRFSAATVRINRPVVQIRFHDGPNVEIAPAHITSDGDYYIPDPDGTGWIKSSPHKHAEYVNMARDMEDRAKPFIRLLKEWKYQRNVPISSFYLEMRAAKHVIDHPPFIMLMDLWWFFQDLETAGAPSMNDPSKFDGRRIKPCPDSLREHMKRSVEIASQASKLAYDCARHGHDEISVRALRILFASTVE